MSSICIQPNSAGKFGLEYCLISFWGNLGVCAFLFYFMVAYGSFILQTDVTDIEFSYSEKDQNRAFNIMITLLYAFYCHSVQGEEQIG